MATLIKTNGEISQFLPQNEKMFTLKELQSVVGGFIQTLKLPNGETLVCNENGVGLKLDVNKLATFLVQKSYEGAKTQNFFGNVLFVTDCEIK
jgi:hypothetical protein